MTVTIAPEGEAAPDAAGSDARARRISPAWTLTRGALWVVGMGLLGAGLWSVSAIGVNPFTVWTERDDIINLLERMWPPKITNFGSVANAVVETFFMAFLGTALAVVLSIPIAFAAASNVMPNPVVRAVARGVIVLARAIPELVLAMIFVRVWSIGPLAGVIALGLHSVGMLGKLFADSIEQIDRGPRDGAAATGAGRLQEVMSGVVPQIVPSFIAVSLYRLDINFRAATILGFVGAGGMGHYINMYKSQLRYQELLGLTLLVIATIIAIELVSSAVRARILGHTRTRVGVRARLRGGPAASAFRSAPAHSSASSAAISARPRDGDRALRPPWTSERVTMYLFTLSCTVLLVLSFVATDISPQRFVTRLADLPSVFWRLVPRDFDRWQGQFVGQFVETVQMGFAATLLALLFALPTGFLAARNVAPARWVYWVARIFVLLLRSLPDLIVAVVFVAALGLGPKPGVLALAIGLYAFASKLFADAIEEVYEAPRDGVRATGATRLQESSTSVLSQAMPAIVGHSLYLLDISIRSSTVLGIVGAGGIGFTITQAQRLGWWDLLGTLMIITFVIVYAIELLAGWIRRRII